MKLSSNASGFLLLSLDQLAIYFLFFPRAVRNIGDHPDHVVEFTVIIKGCADMLLHAQDRAIWMDDSIRDLKAWASDR
jgi:hypothetical protein